ncbi:MAG: exo-alpha-sialidase [Anaerolineaceae bacterium]|nr:exo-alpha-sialidase [Anaerolineaceae bacterium]
MKANAHWMLEDIGTLDHAAFTARLPAPTGNEFSLTFWYCATANRCKQVIVTITDTLEIYLENGDLIAVAYPDGESPLKLTLAAPAPGEWHHVAVIVGAVLWLAVDGDRSVACPLPAISIPLASGPTLRIGGYTDPAGGHFDYTFGRDQTGWVDAVCWYNRELTPTEAAPELSSFTDLPGVQINTHSDANGQVTCETVTAQPERFRLFLWDFGDQSSGIGARISHDYAFDGDYTIRLTAVMHDYRQITGEHPVSVQGAAARLPVTPVFVNGSEGYACYRIPSIVRAANGNLIAFAEGRVESCSDSTATIRLVCKHSRDHGQSWSPVQVVARNIVAGREYVVQNSAPVVDTVRGTGRMVVLYNKLEHSEWALAEGKGSSRICCMFSDDNGASWHGETDISTQVHRPAQWRVQRPTLGHALQLRSGRLVFAGVFTAGDRSVFQSQNYLFWSDDLGATWAMGAAAPHVGLNEAMAVELENGDVLLNSRAYQDEQPVGRRAVTIGRFAAGDTVAYEPTRFDAMLICPAVQASLIRYSTSQQAEYGGKSRLLFANPNHPNARYNLTVRLSYDEGQTWPVSKTVDPGPSAYSDLVIQADGQIGILYERGNQGGIAYTHFTLAWLTDGADSGGE